TKYADQHGFVPCIRACNITVLRISHHPLSVGKLTGDADVDLEVAHHIQIEVGAHVPTAKFGVEVVAGIARRLENTILREIAQRGEVFGFFGSSGGVQVVLLLSGMVAKLLFEVISSDII